jgi:hypothetical protein
MLVLRNYTLSITHLYQIGGGYSSHDLSDITLIWMAVSLFCLLVLAMHLKYSGKYRTHLSVGC